MSDWYARSLEEVERELNTDIHAGLAHKEWEKRLETYGANALPVKKEDSLFRVFARQFKSPLIYVLFVASGVVFLIQEIADALIIVFVLLFNAIIGTIQEGRAQSALRSLRQFVATKATVLRDGEEMVIDDQDVVPGDVLILIEGEKIAADARIVEARSLTTNQAALTGESFPVHKNDHILNREKVPIADQSNMVFQGTTIVGGIGKAIVVATGVQSEIGKISLKIEEIDTEIPLKRDIRNLSHMIIYGVGIGALLLFIFGVVTGKGVNEMLATVVSLSVSVVPEGLPIVLTLVLARGVSFMAKRNALVKRLQAVEALGQARVIAVDKTGTLTRNEMVITKVLVGGHEFDVRGVGYDVRGEVLLGDKAIDPQNHPDLLLVGKIAAFCGHARVMWNEEKKTWLVSGDPTEAALMVLGEKIGFKKNDLEQESPLIAEVPFDYKTKIQITVHNDSGEEFVTVVGAPEEVLKQCEFEWTNNKRSPLTDELRERYHEQFKSFSRKGLRLIALAFVKHTLSIKTTDINIDTNNLVFVGFAGMEDALRPEVPEAMARARMAGIKVVMITGDHALTALSIAREAGIFTDGDGVLTGSDIESFTEHELDFRISAVRVFARVTPEHKMKIIESYRRRHEIIAMTGDGVNDAPSLVAADLGVAMGVIGTEVAKDAADIVLLDDNFGTIISAVEEGRHIYKTIQKVILYLFSTSLGETLTIVGAIALGLPLPVTAAQIVWLNLVTDGFLDISLAMEPKEKNLLTEQFKRPAKSFIDRTMAIRMGVMALPMAFGALWVFSNVYESDMMKAWTITLTTLAIFQWFNAWNCRSERASVFRTNPFSNIFLVGALLVVFGLQLLAVYAPFFQNILRTVPLSLSEWAIAASIAFSILLFEEVRKLFSRNLMRNKKTVLSV